MKRKGTSALGWFAGSSFAGRLPVAGDAPVPPDRGFRLDHRVSLDLLTGKRADSFTVIIDDPLADDILGRRKLDPTARLVAQALASAKQDVAAFRRWEDDGGPA